MNENITPSQKSPDIDAFLSGLMGKSRNATITNRLCMTCSGEALTFRDQLSRKEYSISGMCQKCQDEVFG